MPFATTIVLPAGSEISRLASMKAAWKKMPRWKKILTGVCAGTAALGLTAGILAATVFSGGAVGGVLAGVAVGLNIAAGTSSAIVNGHSCYKAIKAKQYKKALVSGLGCVAGALGSLGGIFHLAHAVNLTAQSGMAMAAGSGAMASSVGAVGLSLTQKASFEHRALLADHPGKQVHTSYQSMLEKMPPHSSPSSKASLPPLDDSQNKTASQPPLVTHQLAVNDDHHEDEFEFRRLC